MTVRRPYRMAQRRLRADQNRQRILEAARELLSSGGTSRRFSVEEVARRAGVARMTVYHQFGSLGGLVTALCDSLAIAGGMNHLADAFRTQDPLEALDRFIAVFVGFWESDREVIRGLDALAALDPELASVLHERWEWRRRGIEVLLGRLARQRGDLKSKVRADAADLLYLLTSFQTYDTLATPKRTPAQVTALLQRLAHQVTADLEP